MNFPPYGSFYGQNYYNNQQLNPLQCSNPNFILGYPNQNQQLNPIPSANPNLLLGYPNQNQQLNPIPSANPNFMLGYPNQNQQLNPIPSANPNLLLGYPSQNQHFDGTSYSNSNIYSSLPSQGYQPRMTLEETIQNQNMGQDLLDYQQVQQYIQAFQYQQEVFNSIESDDEDDDDDSDKGYREIYKFRVGVRKLSCPVLGGALFKSSGVSHACFLLNKDLFEYGLAENKKNYVRRRNVGRTSDIDWNILGEKLHGKTYVSPDQLEQIIIDSKLWTGDQYKMIFWSEPSHNCHDFVQFCIKACAGKKCGMARKQGNLFHRH